MWSQLVYQCLGCTWVCVMTKKDILELICVCGGFYDLPVFRRYLGAWILVSWMICWNFGLQRTGQSFALLAKISNLGSLQMFREA